MSKSVRPRQIPDTAGEFICPECDRKCTKAPSGTEYGHDRGRAGENYRGRCSRRDLFDVDPDKPSKGGE